MFGIVKNEVCGYFTVPFIILFCLMKNKEIWKITFSLFFPDETLIITLKAFFLKKKGLCSSSIFLNGRTIGVQDFFLEKKE